MENYNLLDKKLEETLSGLCLTSIREENKKIASKYDQINDNEFLEIRKDFLVYIKNYLFLKKYEIKSFFEDGVEVEIDGKICEFVVDFDWSGKDENIKLKILDKGIKFGISKYDYKFLFIISVSKGFFVLINSENLKKQIKESREKFNIISENTDLFKTQYISFDLSNLNQKAKIFHIK